MSAPSSIRRIAMWSGPRNISTALMRSWDAREDTLVCDEPFYAHYLHATGLEHPGRAEIIEHGEIDAARVVESLVAPLPEGMSIHYQKHMAHHLLPGMDDSWFGEVEHCLLLRDPARMIVSFAKVIPDLDVEQTGLPQQVSLLRSLRRRWGHTPPVVDSDDLLADPRTMLTALCQACDVPFDEAMLSWEAGPRATDGIWAKHWYANVEASTGFGSPKTDPVDVPAHLRSLVDQANDMYAELAEHKLAPTGASSR